MVEAHGAADQVCRRAALAVAEDLVAVRDLLALEVEDVGRGHVRLAAEGVTLAGRDEREVARLQRGSARLDQAPRPR